MFPDIDFSKPITLDEFLKSSKIVLKESMNDGKPVIFQYRIKKNNETNFENQIYSLLLTLSSIGIPSVISKLVSTILLYFYRTNYKLFYI